ncbi:MAG TPA: FG-GAP repeat protein [Chitinophagaceae bacterium]|jgi:hypothetical protein|nr:FG-GAP repeat protein [Chitinophagaceae bacterium]
MRKVLIVTAGTIFMNMVCAAQNVGIGTSSPTEKLQVNGNTRTDTIKSNAIQLAPNAGTGKVLTSDATGNGSWQNSTASNQGSVGFGGWGDCSVQNISAFNPVVATDGSAGDIFGRSVAISGNFAIIGAPGDQNGFFANQGSAYIFFFDGVNWVQQQKLTASDGAANDGFGNDVSVSGNFVVVGASKDDNGANVDQGSVYIFFYNGTTWNQVQKIDHLSGGPGDQFGYSVCMKGNSVIIGSPYDDIGGNNAQGSADVYGYNGTTWVFQDRLTAADGAVTDNFGLDVTVDGIYAFVGAPFDDVTPNADQGSVHQYFFNGTNWVFQLKITNPNSPTAGDRFGTSVSVSATYCVIGEPFSGISDQMGAAYVYHYIGFGWFYHQRIQPPSFTTGNGAANSGMSVAISGDYFIVVAPAMSENIFSYEGKLFIYRNISGLWQLHEDFIDPAVGPNEGNLMNVAIDNNRFAFGAPQAPLNIARGKVVFGKIE